MSSATSKGGSSSKKPGFMARLFSTGSSREAEDEKERSKKQRLQRFHSVDVTTFRGKNAFFDVDQRSQKESKSSKDDVSIEKSKRKQSTPMLMTLHESSKSTARSSQPKKSISGPRRLRHRKRPISSNNTSVTGVQVDTSKPLEYPATPEMIYEYHRRRPFLDKNEEWLIMELNEYECLVDSLEVIKIIAKHSKFFEVEPDELWEEFFEFMEDVPSYDEIINYDVWQEFRDNKYPC